MKKLLALLSIAATSFGLSGCRMCCPSYDYTSPTDPGTCNNEYCGNERRGSAFSGYTNGVVASDEVIYEEGDVIEGAAPSAPATPAPETPAPKPAPPTAKPMSYGNGTEARSVSTRRAR